MSLPQLILHLVAEYGLILCVAHVFGRLAVRLGQPSVVGMMVAGVFLGPSAFGQFAPSLQAWCFPAETLQILQWGAQLGVGLYLFCTGLEFDLSLIAQRTRAASVVSLAGIAVPFLLAWPLAGWLADYPDVFPAHVSSWQQVVFLGAAIAITAFPMLVWIVRERGLSGTPMGVLAITAGAVDDAFAWCFLALVVSSLSGDASHVVLAVSGALALAVFARHYGRATLAPLTDAVERMGSVGAFHVLLTAVVLAAFLGFSEWIGLHAVFGGFVCGLCLPRGRLTEWLRGKLDPVVGPLLLPLFFTFSGLSTRLDLVLSSEGLTLFGLVLLASVLGKGFACWGAARLVGMDNRSALGIGALMNARGLMELILLGIGLRAGIVGPLLFSVLVLMAIVTTFAATPLFNWLGPRGETKD
ncbi:MAG TPA: cation/H(+) antiporter [Opitutae bacterium]|nr:cation/H(+) antiporter [Opitutae bacterium]